MTLKDITREAVTAAIQVLAKLQVNRQGGLPTLYRPITLLWAFGRARRGDSRLVSWPETQQQVRALLREFGRSAEGDRVYHPVAALHGAGLWEFNSIPEQVPSAHGSTVPKRWSDEQQPEGGLVEPVYDLLHESPETLAAAVNVLDLDEPEDASPLEISLAQRMAGVTSKTSTTKARPSSKSTIFTTSPKAARTTRRR